jgi:nicotinate-nucleotide pyrophosphorylase (carboxylating)
MDVPLPEIDPIPLLDLALREDLGSAGDVTSLAVLDEGARGEAVVRSQEAGVLAGAFLLAPLFARLDPDLEVRVLLEDGARLERGGEICRLSGALAPILAGERTALNFLQRLSGIATRTDRFVSLVRGTRAVILDTRKTTPGLRLLEKRAVLAGGGRNHRFGLHDMILIKDTHVAACGGPGEAVRRALAFRSARPDRARLGIEVEVQSGAEFEEALSAGPDRIMLDNMSPAEMTECVRLRNTRSPGVELEASGNITEETLPAVAGSGVDCISSGGLTHSVRALDIHLVVR